MSTSFDETLHPRGQAANAGQFRVKANDAPAGELAGGADVDAVELTVELGWMERDHIPPRARKPRPTLLSQPYTLTIPALASEDTPIGFTLPRTEFTDVNGQIEMIETRTDLRVHDGRVFKKSGDDQMDLSEVIFYSANGGRVNFGDYSFEAAAAEAERTAEKFVLIDGEPWERVGEPVYVISTMGLGHNHGGTLLNAELLHDGQYVDDEHAAPEHVFPADQRDAAIAAAVALAEGRGDTRSVNNIRATAQIGITGELAPGTSFRPAPRIEYTPPPAMHWDAAPEETTAQFDDYKRKLLAVPGAVIDVPDGWGGTTKTLNRKVLTGRQNHDYDKYCRILGLPVVGES